MRAAPLRSREMFIPRTHAPGEAQADFGEAQVIVADVCSCGVKFWKNIVY